MCAFASQITSVPGSPAIARPVWFAMIPLGKSTAASFPSRAATRSSSAFTVGSSPSASSPTSAVAIAARISGVGRVTVSLRRSTALMR